MDNYLQKDKNMLEPQELEEIKIIKDQLAEYKRGTCIKFGSYYQLDDKKKTPIEWYILFYNRGSNQIQIISKYALDCKPYNDRPEDVNWETCSLRKWLNESFLYEAFTSEEIARIASEQVSTEIDDCFEFETNQGGDTTDKVFLADLEDLSRGSDFQDKTNRKCVATQYAISKGAAVSGDIQPTCYYWWLRPMGCDNKDAMYADIDGEADFLGGGVDNQCVGVRPCLLINLDLSESV